MTLCLAAHAQHNLQPHIVLCSDCQIGDDISVWETTSKVNLYFQPGLAAMYAGDVEYAGDAVEILKSHLGGHPLRLKDYKEKLWSGIEEVKAAALRRGTRRFEEQFIMAGFIEDLPRIIYTTNKFVSSPEHFQCIGAGWQVADAMLRWRELTKQTSLQDALYFSYEAKRMAELSPHVGKKLTSMIVLKADGDHFGFKFVSPAGLEYLEEQFHEFGPRTFSPKAEFPWSVLV